MKYLLLAAAIALLAGCAETLSDRSTMDSKWGDADNTKYNKPVNPGSNIGTGGGSGANLPWRGFKAY